MSKSKCRVAHRQRGFSLLEVLVAMSVLAICVTVLMRVFSSASTSAQLIDDYYGALQVAESRIAALQTERDPRGVRSGEENEHYRWRTEATLYRPDLDNPLFANSAFANPDSNLVSYHFHVSVAWGTYRERKLELNTIQLGIRE